LLPNMGRAHKTSRSEVRPRHKGRIGAAMERRAKLKRGRTEAKGLNIRRRAKELAKAQTK
jgi:hypothetical protein